MLTSALECKPTSSPFNQFVGQQGAHIARSITDHVTIEATPKRGVLYTKGTANSAIIFLSHRGY
jgi:hypothetical protein